MIYLLSFLNLTREISKWIDFLLLNVPELLKWWFNIYLLLITTSEVKIKLLLWCNVLTYSGLLFLIFKIKFEIRIYDTFSWLIWNEWILIVKIEYLFWFLTHIQIMGFWTLEYFSQLVIFKDILNRFILHRWLMMILVNLWLWSINTKNVTYSLNNMFLKLLFNQSLAFLTLRRIFINLIIITWWNFLHTFMQRFFVNSSWTHYIFQNVILKLFLCNFINFYNWHRIYS